MDDSSEGSTAAAIRQQPMQRFQRAAGLAPECSHYVWMSRRAGCACRQWVFDGTDGDRANLFVDDDCPPLTRGRGGQLAGGMPNYGRAHVPGGSFFFTLVCVCGP